MRAFWQDRPDGTYEFLDITIEETWLGMEECYRLGYVKSIGVSNFTAAQVQRIMAVAQIKPVVNQIEWHVNFNRKKMRDFCAARGITITSYSPLGSPRRPWAKPDGPSVALDHEKIVKIGKKYGKTPAQVALRYLVRIFIYEPLRFIVSTWVPIIDNHLFFTGWYEYCCNSKVIHEGTHPGKYRHFWF